MKNLPTAEIINRCDWCGDDPLYQKYHDEEWGVPTFDDATLFEFLILEGAQAGLSWITVLRKRENYRKAFHQFNPEKIARYSENKIQRLKLDAGIIRNDLKIRSAITNAQCYLELCNEKDSLSNYLWNFVDGKPIKNHWQSMKEIPANTTLSDTISKDLKKRGFKFVGSTIVYAYMQSMGIVNDHLVSCHCYDS
ncbi:MAG: DNA-3-methyladenine glycosylase I [Cellvibrionales bacterium]|jgi:DNA-3-methyladenine glycosylase I|nr:DNA-3-methyladenine glycosylase I [Cellvibrionales bacterium]